MSYLLIARIYLALAESDTFVDIYLQLVGGLLTKIIDTGCVKYYYRIVFEINTSWFVCSLISVNAYM